VTPPLACRGGAALEELHERCSAEGRAVVVRWAGPAAGAEAGRLLLVPLQAHEGARYASPARGRATIHFYPPRLARQRGIPASRA